MVFKILNLDRAVQRKRPVPSELWQSPKVFVAVTLIRKSLSSYGANRERLRFFYKLPGKLTFSLLSQTVYEYSQKQIGKKDVTRNRGNV